MAGTSPTLADVAARAGVSMATASRALNGGTRQVSPDHLQRVRTAAQELGYSPNLAAQATARGTTTTIALVVGDIADPYFAQIAAGAIRAAHDARLVLTILATEGDPDREREVLDSVVALRPRGVVLAVSRRADAAPPPALERLLRSGTGVVMVIPDEFADTVPDGVVPLVLESRGIAAELAGALVGQGHRDFALLVGDESLLTARARAGGFLDGLAEHGIEVPASRIGRGAFTRAGGEAAMTALLDGGPPPGCVFAVNDFMALGALAAIRAHGLVPAVDVAVAGFDDIPVLADIDPALSTVRLPLEEMGARAVESAITGTVGAMVTGEVVLRTSTERPRTTRRG